jgi:flavodoxin
LGSAHAGEQSAPSSGEHILIAYLSRTQNTAAIANIIHQEVGGTLVTIEPATPYPEDYSEIVAQVDEENSRGFVPPLTTKIENIRQYQIVFVGFPTWGMQLPPPLKSFLKEHDLSGKTVIPFNTHGGYGKGSSFQTIEALCADSRVLEGFSTKGGLEKEGIHLAIRDERRQEVRAEVIAWLQRLKLR